MALRCWSLWRCVALRLLDFEPLHADSWLAREYCNKSLPKRCSRNATDADIRAHGTQNSTKRCRRPPHLQSTGYRVNSSDQINLKYQCLEYSCDAYIAPTSVRKQTDLRRSHILQGGPKNGTKFLYAINFIKY